MIKLSGGTSKGNSFSSFSSSRSPSPSPSPFPFSSPSSFSSFPFPSTRCSLSDYSKYNYNNKRSFNVERRFPTKENERRKESFSPFFHSKTYFKHSSPLFRNHIRTFHATSSLRRSPFEVLGISKNATELEIRTAYHSMSKKYHPDVCKDADASEKFSEVVKAYNILKDPNKRERAKTADFEEFDYRGNYDDESNINVDDLFQQKDELGLNSMEVLRRVWFGKKKMSRKEKVKEEKELNEKLYEFLRKPKFTSMNVKNEFPVTSVIKESSSEYFSVINGIELQNLTEDKLFILGYLHSDSKVLKDQSKYTWENRTGSNIAEGILSLLPKSSFFSPRTFKLTIKSSDDKDNKMNIGSIDTSFYPFFPFASISTLYDEKDEEITKVSRLHLFGSRLGFQMRSKDVLNYAARRLRPFFFKEYQINYGDKSLHPSFLAFTTIISHQLDLSVFSLVKYCKGLLFKLMTKIKVEAQNRSKSPPKKRRPRKN